MFFDLKISLFLCGKKARFNYIHKNKTKGENAVLGEFIKSLILILMAEMGDKTQILAMAFATKYDVKKVLTGIFIGAFLNHGLAVIFGSYVSKFMPIGIVQTIAGILFIGFALWTLRAQEDEDEEGASEKYGPVVTVAMAFFIGELGDKTQLAAITLASDALFPIFVLMGTVTGMVITGGFGIIIGSRLGKRVPEVTIKVASACIFMIFGVVKLYTAVPSQYITGASMAGFMGVLALSTLWASKPLIDMKKSEEVSLFREKSQELYDYYHKINEKVETICLGSGKCGKCEGDKCIIGYTKLLIKTIEDEDPKQLVEDLGVFERSLEKDFDKDEVGQALDLTVEFMEGTYEEGKVNENGIESVNRIKAVLEKILSKKS